MAQLEGLRFPPGKVVELYWDTTTPANYLGSATSGPDGRFTALVTIPSGALPGAHNVLAYRTSDPPLQVTATFSVTLSPVLNMTPSQGPRGTRVTVALSNLNPQSSVTLYWDATALLGPVPLKGATAWQGSFAVPQSTTDGSHVVQALNTVLGNPVGKASVFFQVIAGQPPSPTPTATPWPLAVQAPPQIVLGQPFSITGQAAPGEWVGIGLFGTWRSSVGDYTFQAMPVMSTTHADTTGQLAGRVNTDVMAAGGNSRLNSAVGVAALRGQAFTDSQIVFPSADVSGTVTYGRNNTPAAYAVVHASNGWMLYDAEAHYDGYYQLFVWDDDSARNTDSPSVFHFPPLENDPARMLRGNEPLLPQVISAYHEEYNQAGEMTAYRWSDPLPFSVHPGEHRTIDIRLTHEITGGPVVMSVTASLDGSQPGDNRFGTFLSLHTLPESQQVPVQNTFTAHVAAIPADAGISWVRFTLAGQTLTDTNPANGWTARFNMSELEPGEHTLTVVAANEYGVISREPWQGTVVVWDSAKRTAYGWLDEWNITWSETDKKYTLRATVPSSSPFWEDDLDLDILGTLHNRLAADVDITETFTISGTWHAEAVGELDATLLSVNVLEALGVEETTLNLEPHYYSGDDEQYHGRPNYYAMYTKTWELFTVEETLYDGIVFTYAGLISARMRIDFGVDGRLTFSLNLEAEDGVPSGRLTPSLGAHANLSFYIDILLGLASAGVTATPQFMAEFPVVLQVTDPYFDVDNPCARFAIEGEAWVKIDIVFWSESWSWGPIEILDVSMPDGCSPAGWPSTMRTRSEARTSFSPTIFAAPSVAAEGTGRALAVWIQDQGANPSQTNPEVVASLWDGYGWNAPQRITNNDRWETDPHVVFLAPDRALAVWTQNELPRDYVTPTLTLDMMLSNQELYYSLWDGSTWSAPARLTNDARPDGSVSLAADPASSRALAAWVHDEDGLASTKGDWEIYFAAWDGSAWSTPAPIHPDPAAELQVSLAYNSSGQAWAVWTHDPDGDLNEALTSDRRSVYSVWNGASWSAPVAPTSWPTGTLYPSVAFDSADNPLVVFTARGRLRSGSLGGIGDDYLYSAYWRGSKWQIVQINSQIAAERPRVVIDSRDQATVLFRGLGRSNTPSHSGEIAVAVADLTAPTLTWRPVGLLTQDSAMDWQITFDVDRATGNLHTYGVKQGLAAVAGQTSVMATTDNGTLYALDALALSDLTLTDADLAVSDSHPVLQTINISATIWNRGLAAASGPFLVRFFHGDSETGQLISQASVPGPIAPNVSTTVSIAWLPPAGLQKLTVEIDPDRAVAESDKSNNTATREIGRPPAPRSLLASRVGDSGRVLLTWKAPVTSGTAGYRVYRANTSGGPFELIGLSWSPVFEDWVNPQRGQANYYVVTVYDQASVESVQSAEAFVVAWEGQRVFLPVVLVNQLQR